MAKMYYVLFTLFIFAACSCISKLSPKLLYRVARTFRKDLAIRQRWTRIVVIITLLLLVIMLLCAMHVPRIITNRIHRPAQANTCEPIPADAGSTAVPMAIPVSGISIPAPANPISTIAEINNAAVISPAFQIGMMGILDELYLGGQTPASNIPRAAQELHRFFDEHRRTGVLFDLPTGFHVQDDSDDALGQASPIRHNSQIYDLIQRLRESARQAEAYRSIYIYALDSLYEYSFYPVHSEQTIQYYCVLAFYGIGNYYVLSQVTDAELIDLFYRLAQVYDYIANSFQDDDMKYTAYFAAEASLYFSYSLLYNNQYPRTAVIYWFPTMDLHLSMIYRLMLHMKDTAGYRSLFLGEYGKITASQELTVAERDELENLKDFISRQ